MCAWWKTRFSSSRKEQESEAGATVARGQASAAEVETEYSAYVSRIKSAIIRGVCVAVVGVVLCYLLSWMTAISAQQSPNPDSAAPMFVLLPLPAGVSLAGFSLLAAVAIGLQLAVRTPSTTESVPATAIARRRFLCEIARIIVLASYGLAVYITIPVLFEAPHVVDLIRLFGPGICATLVALIAADAGVAADPDFAPIEISRVSRVRTAVLLLAGIRMVGGRPANVPRDEGVRQLLLLSGAPMIVGFASSFAAEHMNPLQRLLLAVIALIVAAVFYTVSIRLYVSIVTRDWAGAAAIVGLTVLFSILCWLLIATMMLSRSVSTQSLVPTASTGAWAVIYVAVPAFLAGWALTPRPDGCPRILGAVVGGVLARRLSRRHDGLERADGPEVNRLAAVSPWVSPLLPFGLLLAVVAKQQIRRANRPPARAPQRGVGYANTAIVLTIVLFVMLVATLFVVAAMDPREWSDFMWG